MSNKKQSEEKLYHDLTPTLEIPGRPALSPKQIYASQAEYFIMKAVDRAAWAFRGEYEDFYKFITKLQSEVATEGLATREGMDNLVDLVFSDPFNREVINYIGLVFSTMMGDYHSNWDSLLTSIASAITMSPVMSAHDVPMGLNAVPEEINARMNSTDAMRKWFIANNWAVIVVMIKMWGVVREPAA